MSMKFTDFDIEHFVRFQDEWSTEKTQAIKTFIEHNPLAKELEGYYRDLYMELNKIKREPIYELSAVIDSYNNGDQVVLAADSTTINEQSLETIATFKSANENQVLRVLKNHSRNTIELHLITDLTGQYEFVLVQFNRYGKEFILNDQGVLKDIESEHFTNFDWSRAIPSLRYPIESFQIKPQARYLKFSVENVHIGFNEGKMIVTTEDSISRFLIVQADGITLYHLQKGKAEIEIDLTVASQIFVYE